MKESLILQEAWETLNTNLIKLESRVTVLIGEREQLKTDENVKKELAPTIDAFRATFLTFRDNLQKLDAAMTKLRSVEKSDNEKQKP
jgi:hypothetical protein